MEPPSSSHCESPCLEQDPAILLLCRAVADSEDSSRCASQPLAGKVFTLFSKKLTYLVYLAVFEIGSLVCALAPSSPALIAGRAIAGLGASGMFAGGFVVQAATIPLHKRAIWIGIISATFSVASIVGPVIGGALTQVRLAPHPPTPALGPVYTTDDSLVSSKPHGDGVSISTCPLEPLLLGYSSYSCISRHLARSASPS